MTTNPELCRTCRNLLIRPDEDLEHCTTVEYEANSIRTAAARACPMCILFWEYIQSVGTLRSQEDYFLTNIFVHLLCYPKTDASGRFLDPPADVDYTMSHIALGLRFDDMPDDHCFEIELHRPTMVGAQSAILIRNESSPINTLLPPRSTSAQCRIGTIQEWIQNCVHNHSLCADFMKHNTNAGSSPNRLVYINRLDDIRLANREEFDKKSTKYATLSHRWSKDATFKLSQGNLKQMRTKIHVEVLPSVFHDAVCLCHQLSVPCLWIDAFCIVQDDETDVEQEITKMGDMYSGALCNFGAIAAADKQVALFYESNNHLSRAFPVVLERQGHRIARYGYSQRLIEDLRESTLMKRGWVLQERVLSPRSVYFGAQLVWECHQSLASELFPQRRPAEQNRGAGDWPLRLASLLHDFGGEWMDDVHESWNRLVEIYSGCALSYEDDQFPAISGLARRFDQTLHDEYLAGIWKGDLHQSLL